MSFKGQIISKDGKQEMDLLDRQIFHVLSKNARYSESTIAKALGVKREIINYRIKRMEKKDIIHGYLTLIDSQKLGFRMHMVYIKMKHPQKEKEFLEFVKDIPEITRYKNCRGTYDLQLVFSTKNINEFDQIFEGTISKFSNLIKSYTILEILEENFTGVHFFLDEDIKIKEPKGSSFEKDFFVKNDSLFELDEKDVKILEILRLDARTAISEISKKIDLADISIKNRIKKMVHSGVIKGFFPLGSISQVGYQWWKVFLKLRNVDKKEFLEFSKKNKNILWNIKFVGEWNYQVSVFARNNEEFNKCLNEIREHFSDRLIEYGSVIVLNQFKFVHRVV